MSYRIYMVSDNSHAIIRTHIKLNRKVLYHLANPTHQLFTLSFLTCEQQGEGASCIETLLPIFLRASDCE